MSKPAGRTLVLGDLHGAYLALLECFELAAFDPARDRLIFMGDAADGWSQGPECVAELMKVDDLVYILGNHDVWLMEWLAFGWEPLLWARQGGQVTMDSYRRPQWSQQWPAHLEFLKQALFYYLDDEGRLFVHGGIKPRVPLADQDPELMTWDRELFYEADGVAGYREIYIGHTPTLSASSPVPLNYGGRDNIWRMDTGAGWSGPLSLMDVDTKQVWTSNVARDLYPEEKGRSSR